MKYVRVRYGKALSIVGFTASLIFFVMGIFFVIPEAGAFGIVWTLIALIIAVLHAVNLFSQRGITLTEIEVDDGLLCNESTEKLPFDERLKRLGALRKDNLISEQEYRDKRLNLMRGGQ